MLGDVSEAHPADGRRRGCAAVGLWLIGSLGCIREPLPDICPSVEVGELVISELRGPQDGDDSFGDYIEVYNASGKTVDLLGMTVRLRSAGGDEREFLIRESVELEAQGYVVIVAESGDLLGDTSAFVELEACEELVDEVFYAALPTLGSLACGNADNLPSADANDDSESGCWCVDAQEIGDQPLFGIGLPGSPGGPNRCP
jgi:hypothetical protein